MYSEFFQNKEGFASENVPFLEYPILKMSLHNHVPRSATRGAFGKQVYRKGGLVKRGAQKQEWRLRQLQNSRHICER